MKKILFILCLSGMISSVSYSQSNNTLPSTGNVGIGTVSPDTKFHVKGQSKFDSTVVVMDSVTVEKDIIGKQDVKVDGNVFVNGYVYSDTIYTNRLIPINDSTIYIGKNSIAINSALNRIGWSNSQMAVNTGIWNQTAAGISLCGVNSSKTAAYGAGSFNVGDFVISSPSAHFSVTIGRGASGIAPLINDKTRSFMIGFNSDKPTFFVSQANGAGTYGNVGIGTDAPEAKLHIVNNENVAYNNAFKITTQNAFTKAITLTDNSSGTPTDNFLVYGNGTVYCREVFVKLGVLGDHVFDKDYQLMPIPELKNFLHYNHHLPNVPSEKEVTSTNLNVGEFQATLLQKIEELTLYIIEQHDDITEMKKQLEEYKKELEELKKK